MDKGNAYILCVHVANLMPYNSHVWQTLKHDCIDHFVAHLDYIQQCTRVANAISGLKKATTICGDKEINEEIRNGTINEHIHVSTSKKYTKVSLIVILILVHVPELTYAVTQLDQVKARYQL